MDKILYWPTIKAVDVEALQPFFLFLRGCSNLKQQIVDLDELDMPSNLRNIVMKFPYKLREKWRNVAGDLQDQRGCRAVFTDLVTFVEKQVILPLTHFLVDLQPTSDSKPLDVSYPKQRRKGSPSATIVIAVKEENKIHIDKKIKPTTQSLTGKILTI